MNGPTQRGAAEGGCSQPFVCPLTRVIAGAVVRIKRLSVPPEMCHRLRELGFCEEQQIKLLSSQSNLICLVCNARLAISPQIGDQILVEPVASSEPAA